MSPHERKQLIADQLECIVDDIRSLPDNPMRLQISMVIDDLFQIMRQLADYGDISPIIGGKRNDKEEEF